MRAVFFYTTLFLILPAIAGAQVLYGTNTVFRVEAGDLPEFAMYMPGMDGNWRFGLSRGDSSKWLIKAQYIKAAYPAGSSLQLDGVDTPVHPGERRRMKWWWV